MSSFPVLKTGAIIQFPASRALDFTTDVIQFIDGNEQRFRDCGQPFRRWMIRLDAVDEAELQNVRAFVQENGAANVFSFTDPWDGTVYSTCRIDGSGILDQLDGPSRATTSLVIRECRT